jgi:hypothetical protein
MRIKSEITSRFPVRGLENRSIDQLVHQLTEELSVFLGSLFLTNADVFSEWSRLISFCLEYIQIDHKDCINAAAYSQNVSSIVLGLQTEIYKNTGNKEFYYFLERLSHPSS